MKTLLDKIPSKHINNSTVIAFVIGAFLSGTGIQLIAAIDPSGMASKLQGSMCSDALAAQIKYNTEQIMACIGDKKLCEGKLEILQGK